MYVTEREPTTPGEMLREQFLEPAGLTQGDLAEMMDVTRRTVNELCNDRRSITPDTAIRLGKVFGMTPAFWLNVQLKHDLWKTYHDPRKREAFEKIKPYHGAA